MLTKKQIVLATGYQVADWPGACGVICNRIIEHELVEGQVFKGKWCGAVNYKPEIAELWLDEEFLSQEQPRHCWILLENGKILDPTRWVFEGTKPYIYCGENDFYIESQLLN